MNLFSRVQMAEEFVFGVEEGYQLIDPVAGPMRSRSRDVPGSHWTGDRIGTGRDRRLARCAEGDL